MVIYCTRKRSVDSSGRRLHFYCREVLTEKNKQCIYIQYIMFWQIKESSDLMGGEM